MYQNPKTEEQRKCLNKLKENNYTGTWLAATGSGKTKLGCDVINIILQEQLKKGNKEPKALIIVPNQNLRDNEWLNELLNWNYQDLLPYIQIECIQSAYKYYNKHYNIVVCDEIHTQLSEMYSLFFIQNKFDHIIGLTATIEDEDKKTLLSSFMPVVHKTSVQDAIDLGLIAPFEIYNLSVYLNEEEKKKLKAINYLYGQAEKALGGKYECFSNANIYRHQKYKTMNPTRHKAANMLWIQMAKRRKILNEAASKISMTKQIIDKYPDKKTLVFCKSVKMAEDINNKLGNESVIFHSNAKRLPKKERFQNLDDFSNGKYRILVSVDALSAGLNIPKCELGICVAGTSKVLEDTQRRGRIVRRDESNPDKVGLYFNLYVPNTQDEKWLKSRLKDVDEKYVKYVDFLEEI